MRSTPLFDSPLRNYFKYGSDNVYELLLPFVKKFASAQHEANDQPLPPGAFIIRGEDLLYFNGYSYSSSEEFLATLAIEAETADAVVTLAAFGSMERDFSQGLTLIVAQTKKYYRCRVFGLADGSDYDILDAPYRIELPVVEAGVDNLCHLIGIESLLHPFF